MERKEMPIKIIQFGEGNFLRGFVDWMVQKMNDQGVFNGTIAVVQPLAGGLVHMLEDQDYTYTHILKGMKDGVAVKEHYKNESIVTGLNPYDDFDAFLGLAKIDTANIIVSNTTEAGITFDETDKMDDKADVTFPAKLTRLMLERYTHCGGSAEGGFILLPCELIDKNADNLKAAVLKYIELWQLDDAFKTWVLEANTFCNTLVDRIVPGFPRDTIEQVWEELGYKDNLVVESEQFNLWVIEGDDKVAAAFPADTVGCNALFVEDVTPYKLRKVRILNGSHTTLVPVGLLYGVETVKESMDDKVIFDFLSKALYEEIVPTLTLPEEELKQFAEEVLERFNNPFVKHLLMSISLNSMSKYRTRVLPSVEAYIEETGNLPKHLVLALASYIVFYSKKYKDMTFDTKDNDDILALYEGLWSDFDGTYDGVLAITEKVLGYDKNWGKNLNEIEGLTRMTAGYVFGLLNDGINHVLETI